MRTLLTQDHGTILRDFILNYDLDREGVRIIDFTFGKGGLWKATVYGADGPKPYPYKLTVTKTDAVPSVEGVIKKSLYDDDYSDLGIHEAGVFDPPYLYGHQAFDYPISGQKQTGTFDKIISAQKQGKNSWATQDRFTQNKNEQSFIERVQALNRSAPQCMKKGALLFVKIMDPRHNTKLILNHVHIINHLTNFECYSIAPYFAGGAKTWKNHAELAHGYWMVFRMKTDIKQTTL